MGQSISRPLQNFNHNYQSLPNSALPNFTRHPFPGSINIAEVQRDSLVSHRIYAEESRPIREETNQNHLRFIQAVEEEGALVPRLNDCVVAISSGALFDYREDHQVKHTQSAQDYEKYQLEHEDIILDKGMGFSLVQKLFDVNKKLKAIGSELQIDVIIASKNTPESAFRTMNSAEHYNLPLLRGSYSGGSEPYEYAKLMRAQLFLTTNPLEAKQAVLENLPAALLVESCQNNQTTDQLKIAFDADAVIVSDESEKIAKAEGLIPFYINESAKKNSPMPKGPLCDFLKKLSDINREFPDDQKPLRLCITTARAIPAITRLQKTLKSWDIKVDEIQFLGGIPKGEILKAFKADLFFDDSPHNIESGKAHVQSAHVIYGVNNE